MLARRWYTPDLFRLAYLETSRTRIFHASREENSYNVRKVNDPVYSIVTLMDEYQEKKGTKAFAITILEHFLSILTSFLSIS
jgi:hypothetical protein